jgi:biflaviolin synthase
VHALLTRPDDLRRFRAQPEHLPAAIEESLRFAPFAGTEGLPWVATREVDLGGVRIRQGDAVYVNFSAANRDETVWPDGEKLDFNRAYHQPNLAFGYGIHHCIGAPLARMELQIAAETVLRRFSGLRLAVPEEDITWTEGLLIRRIVALPVTWDLPVLPSFRKSGH